MSLQPQNFDAIIVGARVAGSAAAIMLGRQGRKVLLVDRAGFPSDIISTHIVLGGGARVLERIGAFDELVRAGGHVFNRIRQRMPESDIVGTTRDGAGAERRGICLGRTLMDAAMLNLARSIDGVSVRERFLVSDLLVADGAVVGVRGDDPAGNYDFHAPLVIGADGMRSTVGRIAGEKIAGAFSRTDLPCARSYYYAYYSGARIDQLDGLVHAEYDAAPGLFHIACRCENGLVVAGVGFDSAELDEFKRDLPGSYHRRVAASQVCAEVLSGATLASKVFAVPKLYNTLRIPVCNGALLLGDAGLHVDPILGQGHSFALMSAEIMAQLADHWFAAGRGRFIDAETLSNFTRERDAQLGVHYQSAVAISQRLAPDTEGALLQRAASSEQWAIDELVSFGAMLLGPGEFPSVRLQQLMASAQHAQA